MNTIDINTLILKNATYCYNNGFDTVEITYKDILQNMSNQLSNTFYYISLFLFIYVLINMYVFNPGARYRTRFDKLCDKELYPVLGSSLGVWIHEIIETIALMGAIMMVILNIVYRTGVNL